MAKIERRTMLKTLGGISIGGVLPISGKAFNETNLSGKQIKSINTDILVIGGGTAGVIAAIQAGRAG